MNSVSNLRMTYCNGIRSIVFTYASTLHVPKQAIRYFWGFGGFNMLRNRWFHVAALYTGTSDYNCCICIQLLALLRGTGPSGDWCTRRTSQSYFVERPNAQSIKNLIF